MLFRSHRLNEGLELAIHQRGAPPMTSSANDAAALSFRALSKSLGENAGERWTPWLIVVLLVLSFGRVVGGEFSPVDDGVSIFDNPLMNRPDHAPYIFGPRGVALYWQHTELSLYIPIPYTIWTLLAKATWVQTPDEFGTRLDPHVFHAVSLLLHIANTLLVYCLLQKLLRIHHVQFCWPALAGALIYGQHPLQVETVAWVCGMKDLLYCGFSLIALLAYIRAVEPPTPDSTGGIRWRRRISYIGGIVAMVIGMLCKPTAMVVPMLAFIIDLLILRRRFIKVAWCVLPYLIAAIPLMIVAKIVQPGIDVPTPPLWQRPIVAGASLAFYYGKLVAPVRLSFDYGWRPIEMLQRPWFWWLAAIAAMVAIVLFLLRRRSPWLLAGALVSVAALLPVLGLIPFDFQFFSTVADHYMVLAVLGPSIAVAGLLNSQTAMPRLPAIILIAVGSLILGSLSFFQLSHWRTAEDVAEQMVAVTPDSALGHYNLAMIYQAHSDFEDAKIEYIQTETNPFYYLGATNLTILCARMGDPKRAIEAYYKLLLIANRFPPATRPDTPITPYTLAVEANHYHHTADVPLYMLETARMWFAKNFESWLGGPLVKYLPKPYAVPISPEAYRRQK